MNPLITFSNQSILDWLESKGIRGEFKSYATPDDVLHRHVYGHIPYWLAAYADKVSEVHIPKLSREDRALFNKGELSVAEMERGGAYITSYQVRRI